MREQSVKVGRIQGDKLAANSVHEPMGRKNDEMVVARMGGSEFVQRKSVNELQLNTGTGLNASSAEEIGYIGEALSKDVKINIANLTLIDEKFTVLAECLKKTSAANISQMCSDWWELTDEDEYAVMAF
jgi:hypothetical protein